MFADLRFIVCAALVALTLVGGALGQAALLLLLVPTLWIVLQPRPEWLPLFYILHLPTAAFGILTDNELGEPLWSIDRLLNIDVFARVPKDLVLGGIQMNVALIACVVGFARAVTYTRPWSRVQQAFLVLAAALVFGVVSAFLGREDGNNGWSQSVRYVLTVGAFFWGTTIPRRNSGNAAALEEALLTLARLCTFLLAVGLLRGHLVFLSCGIVAASLPRYVQRRMWFWLVLGLWGFGVSYVQGTLTIRAIIVASLLFSILSLRRVTWFTRFGVRTLGAVVALVTVLNLIVVLNTADERDEIAAFEVGEGSGRGDLAVRARDKLLLDRAPLWRAGWSQVSSPPYVFVPAARPLALRTVGYASSWTGGAHHVPLEALRNLGLIGGALLLFASAVCYGAVLLAMTVARSAMVRVICCGVAATIGVGFATGNFPLQDTTGVLIWSLGGVCFAAAVVHRELGGQQPERA